MNVRFVMPRMYVWYARMLCMYAIQVCSVCNYVCMYGVCKSVMHVVLVVFVSHVMHLISAHNEVYVFML